MVVDLGDEIDIGRIVVGLVAEIQQVVLYRDDLAASGGGVKDHVVRTRLGLDVRARGNQFRQAREFIALHDAGQSVADEQLGLRCRRTPVGRLCPL